MFDYQAGKTPLAARGNFPFFTFLIIVLLVALVIFLIWFISKRLSDYKKSEKFIQKELSRQTNAKDIKQFTKKYELSNDISFLLMHLCNVHKVPNINYYTQDMDRTAKLFHDFYFTLKNENASEEKLNAFFKLNFSIEKNLMQVKKMISTRQIAPESLLLYLTPDNDQLPLTVLENNQEHFSVELPGFARQRGIQPQVLEKLRFIYKNQNTKISYHFISRVIRYQNTAEKTIMICSHTEDLASQTQRHYRREAFEEKCTFSPAQLSVEETKKGNAYKYTVHSKQYSGILKDISGGGCCIINSFPIKEQQLLGIDLTFSGIDEQVIGIIRKTRKLADGRFALHIQFVEIPLSAQNKILAKVYKYEL